MLGSPLQARNSCSSCSSMSDDSGQDQGTLAVFTFIVPATPQPSYLRAALTDHQHFRGGLLLDCREKTVPYPVVHFTDSYRVLRSVQTEGLLGEQALGLDFAVHQGMYREVKHIVPESGVPPFINHQQLSYMLLGFKNLDRNFSQVMVSTWKDWTGARYIYMYLPDDLGLARISLYHLEAPQNLSLFKYLVLVECRTVITKQQQDKLLNFAQRLRAERMTGYISVYTAEPSPGNGQYYPNSYCSSSPLSSPNSSQGSFSTSPIHCLSHPSTFKSTPDESSRKLDEQYWLHDFWTER